MGSLFPTDSENAYLTRRPLMTQSIKEASKHGVPIEGITVPARERPEREDGWRCKSVAGQMRERNVG